MAGSHPHPPDPIELLKSIAGNKPLAIVLAGHNGSGKSTLWNGKLADVLRIPLINADRLMLSILPVPCGEPPVLPGWATHFRDKDSRWQGLSQEGAQLFMGLIMERRIPFAWETVFSYLRKNTDGTFSSKAERIATLQDAGYAVALMFVGLDSAESSILRVAARRQSGGHDVPEKKLRERFPRTQAAIRLAAPVADITIMYDNSRSTENAFTLVRVQSKTELKYGCRKREFGEDEALVHVASAWLSKVAPQNGT